jgi:hypothetical protein
VDSAGNSYVTGYTDSTDFPTTPGAFQTALLAYTFNAFVTKLNPSGSGLVYSTYLGGHGGFTSQIGNKRGGDTGYGIAVDADGNAYVTGGTDSSDFPTTPGAFQPAYPSCTQFCYPPISYAFVTKLNPTGSALVYSTYLGSNTVDGRSGGAGAVGIALGPGRSVFITGVAASNFPTAPGAFQTGAPASSSDVFVTRLNPAGSALSYSTFLSGSSGYDRVSAIAVDKYGNAYITGSAFSTDFPTTTGAFQPANHARQYGTNAFISKLNADGSGLVYSTYVGGTGSDGGSSIAVDSAGNAFVIGGTDSGDFPTTANAIQPAKGTGCCGSIFVLAMNPQGAALVYASYLGDNNFNQAGGIALDLSSSAYVTGNANSANFPTTPGAFQTTPPNGVGGDAFVTKIANITGNSQ